jgi:hypothetical protein
MIIGLVRILLHGVSYMKLKVTGAYNHLFNVVSTKIFPSPKP